MSSDFDFYGDSANEEVVKDIRGITDEVSKYVYSNLSYPCIVLRENISFPKYKWVAISKLVKQGDASKNISFYILRNNEILKAGSLSGLQIKAFIDIVGLDNLFGYYNKDKVLEGDKLYVLSS